MQQRIYPDMASGRQVGAELVPGFGRRVAETPHIAVTARVTDTFLCPCTFFVTADIRDDAGQFLFCEQAIQAGTLAGCRTRRGRQSRLHFVNGRTRTNRQFEILLLVIAIAKIVHLREFLFQPTTP